MGLVCWVADGLQWKPLEVGGLKDVFSELELQIKSCVRAKRTLAF